MQSALCRKRVIARTDIAVLASENQGSKDFAHEKHTRAAHGAAVGAAFGAVCGAALAWFISIQTVTIAGLGPLVAAGPIVAALAGAGAGGALGWIAGWLAGLRQSEYVARRYAGRIRRGGILLSVHCDSPEWCDRARKTLKDTGARNISSAREAPPITGQWISRPRGRRCWSPSMSNRLPNRPLMRQVYEDEEMKSGSGPRRARIQRCSNCRSGADSARSARGEQRMGR